MKFVMGIIITSIALCVGLIGLAVYMGIQEDKNCEAKGGKMVGTGKYQTTLVMAGKTPVISHYEIVKCTKE